MDWPRKRQRAAGPKSLVSRFRSGARCNANPQQIDNARSKFLISDRASSRVWVPRATTWNHFMKKIIPASMSWIWAIAAILLSANAPVGFAKPQKKPAGPGQENPDSLVNAAMKNMETGVWSVNGTVTAKKPIKLQGLLTIGRTCRSWPIEACRHLRK